MNFNGFISDLNIKRDDLKYLILIFIISSVICVSKINYYGLIGFNSDVPVYLSNALYYAGMNPNKILPVSWLNNAPLICFLTSILFRLGFVTPKSLYIVTAVFEVFGVIGCYVYLKNRFDSMLCFLGCIFFMSTYLFLQCSSSGMTDIPALSVSVWILIFTIISFNKNPKYFIVTSLLFFAGIQIRPTVGFVLVPIFLYFVYKHDVVKLVSELVWDRKEFKASVMDYLKSEEFRYVLISCIIFIALLVVFIIVHQLFFGVHYGMIDTIGSSANGFKSHQNNDLGYFANWDYYSIRLLEFISFDEITFLGMPLSAFIVGIMVVGLIIKVFDLIKDLKARNENYYNNYGFNLFLIGLCVILIPIAFMGLDHSHFISNAAIILMFTILVSLMRESDMGNDNSMFFIMNVSWMVMYFVFISIINIKVTRYAMPIFIPIVYLFVLAVETILNSIYARFKNSSWNLRLILFKIVPILLVILLLGTICITLLDNDGTGGYFNYVRIYNDAEETTGYLMDLDEDYMVKNITTDHRERFYNWFLQRGTNQIDNLYQPLSMFDESQSDYLFLNESVKFKNYTEIYNHGNSHLYANNMYDF